MAGPFTPFETCILQYDLIMNTYIDRQSMTLSFFVTFQADVCLDCRCSTLNSPYFLPTLITTRWFRSLTKIGRQCFRVSESSRPLFKFACLTFWPHWYFMRNIFVIPSVLSTQYSTPKSLLRASLVDFMERRSQAASSVKCWVSRRRVYPRAW